MRKALGEAEIAREKERALIEEESAVLIASVRHFGKYLCYIYSYQKDDWLFRFEKSEK